MLKSNLPRLVQQMYALIGPLTVEVGDTTTVIGGAIGSRSDDFILTTGDLDLVDLIERERSHSFGVNVGGSLSEGVTSAGGNVATAALDGTTEATLGNGTIVVGNQTAEETEVLLADVNRDIENLTTITRDDSFDTGEVSIDVGALTRADDNLEAIGELASAIDQNLYNRSYLKNFFEEAWGREVGSEELTALINIAQEISSLQAEYCIQNPSASCFALISSHGDFADGFHDSLLALSRRISYRFITPAIIENSHLLPVEIRPTDEQIRLFNESLEISGNIAIWLLQNAFGLTPDAVSLARDNPDYVLGRYTPSFIVGGGAAFLTRDLQAYGPVATTTSYQAIRGDLDALTTTILFGENDLLSTSEIDPLAVDIAIQYWNANNYEVDVRPNLGEGTTTITVNGNNIDNRQITIETRENGE